MKTVSLRQVLHNLRIEEHMIVTRHVAYTKYELDLMGIEFSEDEHTDGDVIMLKNRPVIFFNRVPGWRHESHEVGVEQKWDRSDIDMLSVSRYNEFVSRHRTVPVMSMLMNTRTWSAALNEQTFPDRHTSWQNIRNTNIYNNFNIDGTSQCSKKRFFWARDTQTMIHQTQTQTPSRRFRNGSGCAHFLIP